jgi:protein-tyrosine phosphatase
MNHFLKKVNIDHLVSCDSAGTISHHAGEPPDARMSATAAKRGLTFTGRARAFCSEDFDRFDIILAMDKANREDLLALSENKEQSDKIALFCQYLRHHDDNEVPDPYYGHIDGFEHVMDLMEDGCENLIEQLQQSLNSSS